MKFAVPWSVKGIRPEARETAKEAARRSGMPLGEWLNSVILQQADEDGVRGAAYRDDDEAYGDEMASVHQRLDDISRRIEQFTRGPAAFAPKPARAENPREAQNRETAQLAQLIARLDQRIEQIAQIPRMMAAPPIASQMPPQMAPQMPAPMPSVVMPPPGIDRAVAEIAARQRALSGGATPGRPAQQSQQVPPQVAAYAPPHAQAYTPAPMMMPVPSQDLSGLEQHLRQITDQIETLRRPGVEDAINALRGELGDIAHALNDAMPRQAIDAIERQIQGLTQRIAEGRQSGGVDGNALSGVEHGLAEVRDALRGLTPAESLIGFNEAVNGLAHKIDLIVAQKDPAALNQLEHAITTLREMAGHVASNEAVGRLAAQVQHLAERVEQHGIGSGAGDALNSLEHRISALADALAQRSQNGATVPPRLESLVESLSHKIEQIQQTRGDSAVGHLEDHIVALVQRLDASDSRLSHLEAIERGLGDVLLQIEELRANKTGGALREDNSQGVAELKHDIARTQNALDAVHGTLGLMVDRLATIERDVRGARSPMDLELTEINQPVGKIAARAVSVEPAPVPQPIPQPMPQPAPQQVMPPQPAPQSPPPQAQRPPAAPQQPAPQQQPAKPQRLPQAARLPINPDLPPDQPLEPGSAPRFAANPAARIAASEAALGGARSQAVGPAGKSGFIAAARRAAQAAIETATPRPPKIDEPAPAYDDEKPSLRASVMKRIKSLLIAASIVAIVIGLVQVGGNMFFKGGDANSSKERSALSPATVPAADADNADTDEAAADANASANAPTMPLSPPVMPGVTTPPPATGGSSQAPSPLTMNPPSLLSPPALTQNPDITGSIGRNPVKQNLPRPAPAPAATPAPAKPEADRLPIALGGQKLRSAAVAGDAAAAYEVALRFSEGRGVPADQEEAARWYERAAGKGLAPAQFRYASLLEKGTGVKKNLGQARKLYLAAATQGHAKAMHNLAVLYAEGIDGKPDYSTAALWFRKAAQHGIADSQYNLGVLCARGLGTDKNIAEAYKWFALAAAQGDREAAKKRDDVAAHLDVDELGSARDTAKSFVPEPQPQAAINVPVPQGGWDDAATTAPQQPAKPRVGRAISTNTRSVSALPMNIGAR